MVLPRLFCSLIRRSSGENGSFRQAIQKKNGSSRKVGGANNGLGEAPKSCTRKEHESATNSIAKRGQGAIAPCRVKGQRPLWGLGQRPNCSASDQHRKRTQQRRRQRSVPAPNFARPQTRPQAALPPRFRDEPKNADRKATRTASGTSVCSLCELFLLVAGFQLLQRRERRRLLRLFLRAARAVGEFHPEAAHGGLECAVVRRAVLCDNLVGRRLTAAADVSAQMFPQRSLRRRCFGAGRFASP